MKKVLFLLLLVHKGWAQPVTRTSRPSADSLSVYNPQLRPHEMKQDLQLFLDIRKKANSGLYRYRSPKQIDSIYQWAFKEIRRPMSAISFYKIILQLTDFEGSCHNYTEPEAGLVGYLNRQRGFFPYALKYIEGNIIFNSPSAPIPVGSQVLGINGVSQKELMTSFYKYITTDGFIQTQKLSNSVNGSYGLRYLYEYGIKDSFAIRFIPPGTTVPQTVTVPAVSLEEQKANLKQRYSAPVDSVIDYKLQPKYSFRMLNPSTGLLNLRIFTMATGADDPAFAVYVAFIDSVFQALSHNLSLIHI